MLLAVELDRALRVLEENGLAFSTRLPGNGFGRPTELWVASTCTPDDLTTKTT